MKALACGLLMFCLGGCAAQRAYPTHLRISGEFLDGDAEAIWDAALRWQAAGSHLMIDHTSAGTVVRGVTDDITPIFPDDLGGARDGLTDDQGVHIDINRLHVVWAAVPNAVRRTAMHEMGHVLGLGAPAGADEHINIQGDIMCAKVECVFNGNDDGALSVDDVAAWRSGGAR